MLARSHRRSRLVAVLPASQAFHGWWDARFITPNLFSTLLDFLTCTSALEERVERLSRYPGTLARSLPKHVLLWTKLTLEGRSHALICVEPRWGRAIGRAANAP